MAYLLINSRFHQAPEVLAVGNSAIGFWVRIACYHAHWQDYDVPHGLLKMCRATKRDLRLLIDTGWLIETDEGWRLGLEDSGLWKISNTAADNRPSRPAIPAEVRAEVMERDEYTCQFCSSTENLSLDHIVPYSHGGPDTVENLRVLCRRCNSVRGNRVEVESG